MIEPKRLEELIEQSATIWYDGHFEIKLNPEQYSITEAFEKTVLWYQPKDKPSGYDWSWELDVLREDIDRAKWEHDMYTERTEKFEPPMWNDIELPYHYRFTINNIYYVFDISNGKITILKQFKHLDKPFEKPATKENYGKACEIVRDLFKEEK